ncbi:uncharacterized protein LOC102809931 [Saccoglossus kowalevskii]
MMKLNFLFFCLLSIMYTVAIAVREHKNGWAVRNRYYTDSGSQQTFVDKNLVFNRSGIINKWRFYSRKAGIINLQVWRPESENGCRMTLVNQTTVDVDDNFGRLQIITLPEDQRIRVKKGDLIGWNNPGIGVITWNTDWSSNDQHHCFKWGLKPEINHVYDLNHDITWGPSRVYSIMAIFTVIVPSTLEIATRITNISALDGSPFSKATAWMPG